MIEDPPFLLDVSRLIWRRWKGRQPTGIDRVCLAYLRHFGPKAQAVVQYRGFGRILDGQASRDIFSLLEDPGAHFKPSLVWGFLKHLRHFGSAARGRFYLNVGHTGLNSARFARWVTTAHVKPIYLIHDLIPITHPEFCRAGEAERHRERMRTVLRTATGVIGNSQATLDDLACFAQEQSLRMPPALAAWLGIDPLLARANVRRTNRPSFIILGTIEGRKNHQMLLNIWARLIDRLGTEAPRLLIVGKRGWEAKPVFDLLDHNDKLRGHVFEFNNCSDERLMGYLASACALLFPSLAEGYGLPLLEALAAGVPAIASDLPVFREICGDRPIYVEPLDAACWEAAILDYSRADSPQRAAQLERMKGFRSPTWHEHFNKVESWLLRFA